MNTEVAKNIIFITSHVCHLCILHWFSVKHAHTNTRKCTAKFIFPKETERLLAAYISGKGLCFTGLIAQNYLRYYSLALKICPLYVFLIAIVLKYIIDIDFTLCCFDFNRRLTVNIQGLKRSRTCPHSYFKTKNNRIIEK